MILSSSLWSLFLLNEHKSSVRRVSQQPICAQGSHRHNTLSFLFFFFQVSQGEGSERAWCTETGLSLPDWLKKKNLLVDKDAESNLWGATTKSSRPRFVETMHTLKKRIDERSWLILGRSVPLSRPRSRFSICAVNSALASYDKCCGFMVTNTLRCSMSVQAKRVSGF